MKTYFAIVTSVAHLPPARDMVSLTALRLNLGDGCQASLLFPDSAPAATLQVGDWIAYSPRNNVPLPPLGFQVNYLPMADCLIPLERIFPTEVSRLLALRQFFEKQELRQHPDERELANIDHHLQRLRANFNTTRLPLGLVLSVIPAEFQSREMR